MSTPADMGDVTQLWNTRAPFYGDDHDLMDTMVNIYFGNLSEDFDDYFPPDMHVHLPNMIRLSWDDLTTMAGKEFPINVRADNATPTAKARAEHLEMIGYNYNDAGRHCGGVSMKLLMQVLAWWMVGCANAVALTLPNYVRKTPYFTYRDPRTFFPPVGWTPFNQSKLEDAVFSYMTSIGDLKVRYPERAVEIGRKLERFSSGGGWSPYTSMVSKDDSTLVWVAEYYHKDSWMFGTVGDQALTLSRTDTGDLGHPGVQPVVPMGMYSPLGPKGRSMFADQVSIEAALARMFSQKLDAFDRTLYPMIFHTPVSGRLVRVGPYATNEYDTSSGITPRLDVVQPAVAIDAQQMMQFTIGLSRMLNRNPEQFQGGGQAESAKALQQLQEGVTATVRDSIWPPMIEALPRLYEAAATMDLNIWKYDRRYAVGQRKNSFFRVPYTPATDLLNRESSFEVEPGLGLAGYQGTVQILQLLGAESIAEDDALEQLDDVKEPQETKRKIFADRMQKVIFADLAAKSQMGALQPGAMAEIRQRALKGDDPYDVIAEMERAGRLVVPPPSAEQGAPGAPGAAPAAGGGGMPSPTLEALRGLARR